MPEVKHYALFSFQVVSLELMTAGGEVIYCSREQNKEIFLAALCGLGAVGIILSLTWQCEEAFKLQEKTKPLMLEEVWCWLYNYLLTLVNFQDLIVNPPLKFPTHFPVINL